MKKKILYSLLLVTLCILTSGVAKAVDVCSTDETKTLNFAKRLTNTEFATGISGIMDHSTTYLSMTLDGVKSLCNRPNFRAERGAKYRYVRVASTNERIAYGLYTDSSIFDSDWKWAVAQYIAWYGYREANLVKILYIFTNGRISESIAKEWLEGLDLEKYKRTRAYIWESVENPATEQPMITGVSGCKKTETTPEACPSGSMVKSGSIGDCSASKGGNTYSFSNVPSVAKSDQTDIHSEYGKKLQKVGKYCSLFCQEFGVATLPGETGEPFNLGSYIIWPTSTSNNSTKFKAEYYPLKFTGTLECKLGVQPDDKLPGDYNECHLDPVEQYSKLYTAINNTRNSRNFNGITLENVRKSIGRTTSASSKCKAYYDTGGEGCSSDEKCLTPAEKRLEEAQKRLSTVQRELSEAQTIANNVNPKTETIDRYCTNTLGERYKCGTVTQDTSEYTSARQLVEQRQRVVDAAQQVVNTWQSHVNNVKTQISNCTTYINNFESATGVLQDMSTCGSFQITTDVYDFNSSASMLYNDEKYNTGDVSLETSNKAVTVQGTKVLIPEGNTINDVQTLINETPTSFKSHVEQIKNNEYEVTATNTYTLTTGYRYIDKDTLDYMKDHNGSANYLDIGKEVIPTSYNNVVGKQIYTLSLENISFGSSWSNFGISQNGVASNYVCKQEFKKGSDDCVCPENTLNAGKPLSGFIANTHDTCADAQTKYCDKEVEFPDDADLYCDFPMDNVSIAACVNAGKTVSECKQTMCNGTYKCKNSNNVGGYMDITSCVQTKMAQGLSQTQAINYCDSVICPIGKTIIYRTIKLENPFPGKNISGIVSGFNNDVKGRYPGTNWNSKITVYNEIRNNRGGNTIVDENQITSNGVGTTIYQTKKPLYTFVLNGSTIKSIREYNKNQEEGYNDFTLDCKKGDSSACVSSFVHNILYGLTDGTCRNVDTQSGSFYACDD